MSARLMWELVNKPRWIFRLVIFALLSLGILAGTRMPYLYLVAVGSIALMGPTGDAFWILGLSRRDYNLQRRVEIGIAVTVVVVVMVLITQIPWFVIGGYLAIAAVVLAINVAIPQRDSSREMGLISQSSGRTGDGRFSPSIEGQLIDRPQAKGWMLIGCLTIVTSIVYWATTMLWGSQWSQLGMSVATIWAAVFLMVQQDTFSTSLREYVTFGGTRCAWAQRTIVINAIVPCLLIVVGAVVPGWGIVSEFGSVFLLIILAAMGIGLITKKNWTLTVPVIITAVVLGIYAVTGIVQESYVLPTMAALAGYGLGGLMVPAMAKRADIYSGGLTRWLGMAPTAR